MNQDIVNAKISISSACQKVIILIITKIAPSHLGYLSYIFPHESKVQCGVDENFYCFLRGRHVVEWGRVFLIDSTIKCETQVMTYKGKTNKIQNME